MTSSWRSTSDRQLGLAFESGTASFGLCSRGLSVAEKAEHCCLADPLGFLWRHGHRSSNDGFAELFGRTVLLAGKANIPSTMVQAMILPNPFIMRAPITLRARARSPFYVSSDKPALRGDTIRDWRKAGRETRAAEHLPLESVERRLPLVRGHVPVGVPDGPDSSADKVLLGYTSPMSTCSGERCRSWHGGSLRSAPPEGASITEFHRSHEGSLPEAVQ